jgi:DNA-binding NtrC family response regulator
MLAESRTVRQAADGRTDRRRRGRITQPTCASGTNPCRARWCASVPSRAGLWQLCCIEDEEQVRVLAEAIIAELGHETLTAATAEQALALVRERPDIDILFTDIGLQQDLEAGLQLAKDISAQKPKLPVLYTTGQGVTDGMRALFAEPFGFLPKPYTPQDLKTALCNLLAA